MKPLHGLLGVALVGAAMLAWWGDKTPTSAVVEPVARAVRANSPNSTRAAARATSPRQPESIAADDTHGTPSLHRLIARAELIGGAHGGKPEALFASQNWDPPAPPAPPPSRPAPPPPPTAPVLPFTFLGKQLEDGVWQVFLARGDDTFIVHEHSVIDGMYRVDTIVPPQLSLTYLPMKHRQIMFIGGLE